MLKLILSLSLPPLPPLFALFFVGLSNSIYWSKMKVRKMDVQKIVPDTFSFFPIKFPISASLECRHFGAQLSKIQREEQVL